MSRRLRARLLVSFVLTLPLLAQTGKVSGKVLDENGAPVPDLRVMLVEPTTKTEKEIRTDPDGSFTLEGNPGTYSVGIDKPGRGTFAVHDVRIEAGKTVTVNLEISSKLDNRNFRYMFYGFLAAWLVLVIYVISLVTRESGLRKQIDDLKRMVESERR